MLKSVLEYLEEHISEAHIEEVKQRHIKSLNYDKVDHLPVVIKGFSVSFEKKPYSKAFNDIETMMYNELIECVRAVDVQDDSLLMIRANYGVGTLPSLFGMKSILTEGTDMPWCEKAKSIEEIEQIIFNGVPELSRGFGDKVIETYKYYREQLKPYPKCKDLIKLYHPDLQGPFDIAHLIWGSDIFIALYDKPDMVHALMQVVTDTYISFMQKIKPYLNEDIDEDRCSYHWGNIYLGSIVLRNDAAVNVSNVIYEEFIRPYDEQVLSAFGGGSTHFCGRADQNVFQMAEAKGNRAMNFGYMPNIEFGEVFLNMVKDKFTTNKIPIVGYTLSKEEYADYESTFDTGISLQTFADTLEEAKEIYLKRK